MKNRKSQTRLQTEIHGIREELAIFKTGKKLLRTKTKGNIITNGIPMMSKTENTREIVEEICDKLKVKSG